MPYGYDVANAKLPQAADPLGSLMQGGVQGITLGLGLQKARQDANLNQLQQQKAELDILTALGEQASMLKKLQSPELKKIFYEKGLRNSGKKMGIEFPDKLEENLTPFYDAFGELTIKYKNGEISENDFRNGAMEIRTRAQAAGEQDIGKDILETSQFIAPNRNQSTGSLIYLGQQDGSATLMNNKTGEMRNTVLPGNGPLMPKNVTNEMSNSSLFATRANDANQQLNGLVEKGFDPTAISAGFQKLLPNYFQGENAQALEQIGRNFGASVLRKESGAAITQDEWKQVKLQYIPQPGDKPETLKQKEINRERAIQGLGYMGGQLPELQNTVKSFKSVAEAESANLPPGTIIEINGRRARVE